MVLIIIVVYILAIFNIKKASSESTTVRLYDSFAEIRQPYTGPLRFRQADWDNIKHESIILQSASDTSNTVQFYERRVVRVNANMTGQFFF